MKTISGQTIIPAKQSFPLGSVGVYGRLIIKYQFEISSCNIFIGNDGNNSVSPDTGYLMTPNESIIFDYVELLSDIFVYADYDEIPGHSNEQSICWLILGDDDND